MDCFTIGELESIWKEGIVNYSMCNSGVFLEGLNRTRKTSARIVSDREDLQATSSRIQFQSSAATPVCSSFACFVGGQFEWLRLCNDE